MMRSALKKVDAGRSRLKARLASTLCAALICAASGAQAALPVAAQDAANFLTVALPATAEVTVTNQRGDVRIEVWDEPHVGVAYSGGADVRVVKGRRRAVSPVQIERSEMLLAVSVPRAAAAARQTPVELSIRLPRTARARVFTTAGRVDARGVPAFLSAQTVSGDIRLGVAPGEGAEVTAHSLNGTVLFESAAGAAETARQFDRAKFETRIGNGGGVARLFSGRGTIYVNAADAAATAARPAPTTRLSSAATTSSRPAPTQTPAAERVREEAAGRRAQPPALEEPARTPAGTPDTHPKDKPQEVDEDEVVRVDTELVSVNVGVVDRARGTGLTGLRLEDFQLYEDNVEQRVEHFEAASAPFDLVLLIDLSGSTGRVTDLIRAAAQRFIDAARSQDRIGVVTFAGDVSVVSPLTTDRAALRAAVRSMQPPQGHTRLYDAAGFALEHLDREANQRRRRAVVLMSDGLDSTLPNVTGVGSTLPFEELRSRVQEFDGLFYSIWTSTEYEAFSPEDIQPETFELASQRLEGLAETGGGVFYDVEKLEDLAGAYERIVQDLGTIYTLSYRPTNRARDGKWRAIKVRLPNHPQAVARGKRGYFAN